MAQLVQKKPPLNLKTRNHRRCEKAAPGRLAFQPDELANGCAALRPKNSARPQTPEDKRNARAAMLEAKARRLRATGWKVTYAAVGDRHTWTVAVGPGMDVSAFGTYGVDDFEPVLERLLNGDGRVSVGGQAQILGGYSRWVRQELVPGSEEGLGKGGHAPVREKGPLANVGAPIRGLAKVYGAVSAAIPLVGLGSGMLGVGGMAADAIPSVALRTGARGLGMTLTDPERKLGPMQKAQLKRKSLQFDTFNRYMTLFHPKVHENERQRLHRLACSRIR